MEEDNNHLIFISFVKASRKCNILTQLTFSMYCFLQKKSTFKQWIALQTVTIPLPLQFVGQIKRFDEPCVDPQQSKDYLRFIEPSNRIVHPRSRGDSRKNGQSSQGYI